jgi:hypothetical protein
MEVTVEQVESFIQDAFNNAVKSEQLSQKQIANLEEKLALVAFNMCAAGIDTFANFNQLASWFIHLRAKNHGQGTRMRGEIPKERPLDSDELAKALVLAEHAEIAGLLETEGELYRFVYLEVQAYFAALYISLNLKNYELLERAQGFKTHEVWQFLAYLDPSLENRLIKELQNRNSDYRSLAANGLGKIRSQRAVPILLQTIDDLDGHLGWKSAEALAEIGDPVAIPAIVSGMRYALDKQTRLGMTGTLAKFGASAVPELLKILDEGSSPFPLLVVSYLDEINKTLRDPQLQARLDRDTERYNAELKSLSL